MTEKRKFHPDAFQHIYQISRDGGVLFYSREDFLVLYTIMSVTARKYGVNVYCVSYMINHLHLYGTMGSRKNMVGFVREYGSVFAKEYRDDTGVAGGIFSRPFGMSQKFDTKKKRSCAIYVDNNGVEKKVCAKAIDYRWNFMAYELRPNPFSERLVIRRAGKEMRRAIAICKGEFKRGRYLKHDLLRILFERLNHAEAEQLTDYVIQLYRFIDHRHVVEYFGGWDNYLTALDSTNGSDYDISEPFDPIPDTIYRQMSAIASSLGYKGKNRTCRNITQKERSRLIHVFRDEYGIPIKAISRFLHVPEDTVAVSWK